MSGCNLFFFADIFKRSCLYYPSGNSLHNYARGICHHKGEHISEPKLPEAGTSQRHLGDYSGTTKSSRFKIWLTDWNDN